MARDLLKRGRGRFFRGNLHCHSDKSDGHRAPDEVVAAYRDAGYDFIVLSDHFEEEYDWQLTDTSALRDERFTTILGAELSSGSWDQPDTYWVVAAGLPADFPPPRHEHAEAIRRARDEGAFVVMLHPGLNHLLPPRFEGLPALEAIHAIEIYNHNMAMGAGPDGSHGAYLLEALLEKGFRVMVTAGDDAHFDHPKDRFGGRVEVYSDGLQPDALLDSLKRGDYFSTQGPSFRELQLDGNSLLVETSEAYAITLTGPGDRWLSASSRFAEGDEPITEANFDVTPFIGSYCRITIVDHDGKRAWSNPLWP
jgi:histidinol phosphatase-like PHP family hydrolase